MIVDWSSRRRRSSMARIGMKSQATLIEPGRCAGGWLGWFSILSRRDDLYVNVCSVLLEIRFSSIKSISTYDVLIRF
uniref:Uncharacterized protein n=1 Tax=Oryza brachyantha TaxID=4533 RepID=J3NC82_ORYBR